jgi:large subunit ribosomal protein L29
MNYSEVKALSAAELKAKVKESQAELFEARMKHSLGQLANPMELRRLRKDIARMKMVAASGAETKSATKPARSSAPKKKAVAAKRGRK